MMHASDPSRLTATDAARLIRDGQLRPTELMEACLERIAQREPHVHAFAHINPDTAKKAAAASWPRSPPRTARRRERRARHRRPAQRIRLTYLEGPPAPRGRCCGRLDQGRGWRGDRQDRHHGVRHPQTGSHRQPTRHQPHTRRQLQRLSRRRGRLLLPPCLRHPNCRQRHPPGRVLRRRRLQAQLRADQSLRHEAHVRQSRHRRRDGPQRRRLRTLRRSRLRPRPGRPLALAPTARPASASAAARPGTRPRPKPATYSPAPPPPSAAPAPTFRTANSRHPSPP